MLSSTASLAVVRMATIIKPRHEPAPFGATLAKRHVSPWNTLEAERVLGNRVRDTLSVSTLR